MWGLCSSHKIVPISSNIVPKYIIFIKKVIDWTSIKGRILPLPILSQKRTNTYVKLTKRGQILLRGGGKIGQEGGQKKRTERNFFAR